MKWRILLFALMISFGGYSQDYIMLLDGDEIKSKVLEINDQSVKYKKYSNLDGPTYTINKSEIFLIKYASGDKDVFNSASTSDNNSGYAKPDNNSSVNEFRYYPDLGNKNCQVQKSRGAKIFGDKPSDVFFRGDLVWYGYDFTYVRLSNPRRMGEGMSLVQKYFNEWNEVLNKEAGIEEFKRWLDKSYMMQGTPVFPNYYQRDFNDFVTYGNYCISFDELQTIVNSYEINEKHGVGMVIVLVNFNKDREFSMQYVTFFDLETREIVYAVLTTGEAGGSGMTGHWATGVIDGVRKIFVDEVYKERAYNNGMIHSNLRLY